MSLVSDIQSYYSALPENMTKIQNSWVHGNALKTIFWENTEVGLLRTAGAFMILMWLPEL